jgi:hypothetical protein
MKYKVYKPQVEEFKKLLAGAQTKNILIDNNVKNKDLSIDELTKCIEKLNQDNQKELVSLKKENELNIRLACSPQNYLYIYCLVQGKSLFMPLVNRI